MGNYPQMTGSINLNGLLQRQPRQAQNLTDPVELILSALQSSGTSPDNLINTRGSMDRRRKFKSN